MALAKASQYTAINFAKDVVEADGLDPDYDTKWVKKIAARFRERFGADEIDKSTFIDRVRGHQED
ncbi:MAG: hypothetical protein AAFY76_11330 [Cyanobacteria bacterium J06649_11]